MRPARPRRARRPGAPARRGLGAARRDRVGRAALGDPLRPAGHRQDDARADHRRSRRRRLRGGVGRQRRPGRGAGGDRAGDRAAPRLDRATIFFLDEIHRFNKAQQDALLPAVEEGLVTLIGATTENPYFEVNSALLSRCADLRVPGARPAGRSASSCAGRSRTPSAASPIRRRSPTTRWSCSPPAPAATPGPRWRRWSARWRRPAPPAARVDVGDRRGRAAAQGAPLRPRGRPPLRLHLRLDQGDPRLRRRRLALLPRGDARGRRGPPLHRPADGHPRLRGHRQRRPAGAGGRHRRRRRRSTASGCRSARSTWPRPRPTWRWRRSRTPRLQRPRGGDRATSASTARSRRRPTSTTPTTPARRSSAAARATSTRTTSRAASPTSRWRPRSCADERFYEPTDRGFEAELRGGWRRCGKLRRSGRVDLAPDGRQRQPLSLEGELRDLAQGEPAGLHRLVGDPSSADGSASSQR